MTKAVLSFSSLADIALFIIDCKISHIAIDQTALTLTGEFNEECLQVAISKYGATIAGATDFIQSN
jgi:hypothetical protein